ncbi:MAG: hypothetical protein ACI9TF_000766 [Paracrocinitomix sp.]|jgi:hypothetical protein
MDFEQRIQVLEDIEAIRKLKAAYCAACDDDHNGDAVAALFVPDATWGAAGRDPEMGQGEIRDFMFGVRNRAQMARSAHQVFNPVIEVDGDTATGDWRFLMMYTATDEQSFVRIIGTYDETYVRTDGGWKFQSLEVTIEERGVYATAEDGPI